MIDFLRAESHGRFSECEIVNIENILNIGMKIDLLAGYLFVRCFWNKYISLNFLSITDVKVLVFGLVIDDSLPDLLVAFPYS